MADFRAALHRHLLAFATAEPETVTPLLDAACTPDTVWRFAAPAGTVTGARDTAEAFFVPVRTAIPDGALRNFLVLGGVSTTGSGQWVATLGHLVGNFQRPLFGVPAHGKLVFFRVGAFYRLEGGLIAETAVLFDLPDLMRQAGCFPFDHALGTEMMFPGPATHDGFMPQAPERSATSLALVEAMLRDLHSYDPVTFQSAHQSGNGGYWARDMLWYGPGGIGSNHTYAGFQRDHRIPLLTAFPDRKGGNHFARFGDGDYVCSGGWPSMTMTHTGPYRGVAATGRRVTLRVMDFWRCAGGQIAENWVLLDLVDLFAQMGVDLIARARA